MHSMRHKIGLDSARVIGFRFLYVIMNTFYPFNTSRVLIQALTIETMIQEYLIYRSWREGEKRVMATPISLALQPATRVNQFK